MAMKSGGRQYRNLFYRQFRNKTFLHKTFQDTFLAAARQIAEPSKTCFCG